MWLPKRSQGSIGGWRGRCKRCLFRIDRALIRLLLLQVNVMDDAESPQTVTLHAVELSVKKHYPNGSHDVLRHVRSCPNGAYAITNLKTLLHHSAPCVG
jgi:hypothetical protein